MNQNIYRDASIPLDGKPGKPFYLYYAHNSYMPGAIPRQYGVKPEPTKYSLLKQFNENQTVRYTSNTDIEPYFQYGDDLRQWSLMNASIKELCGCGGDKSYQHGKKV